MAVYYFYAACFDMFFTVRYLVGCILLIIAAFVLSLTVLKTYQLAVVHKGYACMDT